MSTTISPALTLSDFDFDLPEERIAAFAVEPRDHARLLHVKGGVFSDHHVYDLPSLLREGDLLIMNDTRVIPARLFGFRGEVKVEVLLNKQEHLSPAPMPSVWSALARPGKRLRIGDTVTFGAELEGKILEKREGGEILIGFPVPDHALFALLQKVGHVPLPPYIKRPGGDTAEDRTRYQTVYAKHEGAVAAPTAGLHFTPELLGVLQEKGIHAAMLTLHVGAGTFLPVKTERVADHVMHAEWGAISEATANQINTAKKDGRRIIAVGTTSLRLLESAADQGGIVHPFCADTSIFITPGYRFRAVNALLTNFHLPKSTLFMLVSALAGRETMLTAYKHAVEKGYRFYSYGDASLLEP